MTDELAARRARIQRLAAKRPRDLRVTVERRPDPSARDRALDLLLDLDDELHSGRP